MLLSLLSLFPLLVVSITVKVRDGTVAAVLTVLAT
jgi:hypothetical protein